MPSEIEAVPWAKREPRLQDAIPDRFVIPKVPQLEAKDPGLEPGSNRQIKGLEPVSVGTPALRGEVLPDDELHTT